MSGGGGGVDHEASLFVRNPRPIMPCDIDQIIERLTVEFPHIHVRRLPVLQPSDEAGQWLLALPDRGTQVQIEAHEGNAPFLIKPDLGCAPFRVPGLSQALAIVRKLLL